MIKKFLLAALLIFPMFAVAQDLKIGIVDVLDVMEKHPDYAAAQTTFLANQKQYEDNYNKLAEEFKRLYDEYSQLADDTPQTIRERKEHNLQEQQQKIQQYEQTIQQDLARLQQELMQPIQMKIQEAIQSVGQEERFSLIEVKDNQIVLYYAAPVVDVTPLVKAKLGIQ